MGFIFVSVALVNRPLFSTFDYKIRSEAVPPVDKNTLKGARVLVPFGNSTQSLGIITRVIDAPSSEPFAIKEISALLDDHAVMGEDVFDMVSFGASYYHYPIGQCFFTALPLALREGRKCEFGKLTFYALSKDFESLDQSRLKSDNQKQCIEILKFENAPVSPQELKTRGISPYSLKALTDKGFIRQIKVSSASQKSWHEIAQEGVLKEEGPRLNGEQEHAVAAISAALNSFKIFMLFGITGSGKTEVYLNIIKKVLEEGKAVLVLVPEIALTPQTMERFYRRFNVPIAAIHSAFTDKERFEAYLHMKFERAGILIGTRSALFAPIPNLGLIVIDEEHDSSFKQADGFRYHARSLAIMRAGYNRCPVVLGSATPSLETVYNALNGRYVRLDLKERAGGAKPPQIELVDLRDEPVTAGLACGIGQTLENAVGEETVRRHQALLFLNRRGYSRHLTCHHCGKVFMCPNCDNLLTVHRQERLLRCHVCEYQTPIPRTCYHCGQGDLLESGFGTEQVEEFLKLRYPDVGIERIDRDTVKNKDDLESKLNKVRSLKSQIMVGTQMLAKGHDFPEVTLVGIIDVDSGLYSDDFRSLEFTAQLLTQVSGRAGRAQNPGKVLVQSHHLEHFLLQGLCDDQKSYLQTAHELLALRQAGNLPPYTHQALIESNAAVRENAHEFLTKLKDKCEAYASELAVTLGPAVSDRMEKRHNRYHFHFLATASDRASLKAFLDRLQNEVTILGIPSGVRFAIDVDPIIML